MKPVVALALSVSSISSIVWGWVETFFREGSSVIGFIGVVFGALGAYYAFRNQRQIYLNNKKKD